LSWQRPNTRVWREVAQRWLPRGRDRTWVASAAVQAELLYALIGQSAPISRCALRAAVGGNARLSEHRGEVVVLSFWSSRCTPCRTQLAALNRSLTTYHSAGLAMFGIGVR